MAILVQLQLFVVSTYTKDSMFKQYVSYPFLLSISFKQRSTEKSQVIPTMVTVSNQGKLLQSHFLDSFEFGNCSDI